MRFFMIVLRFCRTIVSHYPNANLKLSFVFILQQKTVYALSPRNYKTEMNLQFVIDYDCENF